MTSEELLALAVSVEAHGTDGACPLAIPTAIAVLGGGVSGRVVPSFDDALGLMGKGWVWLKLTGDSVSVYRSDPHVRAAMRFDGYHKQPAPALVAAILKAKADSLAIAEKTGARGLL